MGHCAIQVSATQVHQKRPVFVIVIFSGKNSNVNAI